MTRAWPRYVQPAVAVASLAGLAVSVYLTFVHYAPAQLYCYVGGPIDCGRVLQSPYSVIAGTGVPTSFAGILWFAAAGVLAAGRMRSPDAPALRRLQAACSWLGLVAVLGLVFVEIVLIGAICAWCTAAHVLVLAIFVVTVTIPTEGADR